MDDIDVVAKSLLLKEGRKEVEQLRACGSGRTCESERKSIVQ